MVKAKAKGAAALAAAAALALALAAPAFADTGVTDKDYNQGIEPGGSFDATTEITANFSKPTAKVIKVTLPSTMPVNVATKLDADDPNKQVFDSATGSTATVKNYSKDQTVDIKVAKVVDATVEPGSGLLGTYLKMTLTPATSAGTAAGAYELAAGDSLDVALFTGLTGTTDGTTNPGEGTLELAAAAGTTDDLTKVTENGGSYTVTATLKVVVPNAAP